MLVVDLNYGLLAAVMGSWLFLTAVACIAALNNAPPSLICAEVSTQMLLLMIKVGYKKHCR